MPLLTESDEQLWDILMTVGREKVQGKWNDITLKHGEKKIEGEQQQEEENLGSGDFLCLIGGE